jgi:hypothetical protein
MKLETLLKPVKYLDENIILRQYTKLGKRINIDVGKRKYRIASLLNPGILFFSSGLTNSHKNLFGPFFLPTLALLDWGDQSYNVKGLYGKFKEEDKTSDSIALDPLKEKYRKYNSIVRLPTFLLGLGLIGKFGIDAVNSIKNRTALEPTSWYCLQDGIGHLSVASSMYLKETDPKILDKVPLWKQALEYVKEKASLIGQQPVPVPVTNYQIAENQ